MDNVYRLRNFEAFNPKWNFFLRPFSSRPKDINGREGRKIISWTL